VTDIKCYWCGQASDKEETLTKQRCPKCKSDYMYEDLDENAGYTAFSKGFKKLIPPERISVKTKNPSTK